MNLDTGFAEPDSADAGDWAQVLVISRSPATREKLKYYLRANGYAMFLCIGNLDLAEQIHRRQKFDLIIVDTQYYYGRSIPFVTRMRALHVDAHPAIVALLGFNSLSQRKEALAAGADEVLVAPLGHDQIGSCVREQLRLRRF